MKFATRVIHAGIEPDPSTGAIMTPIYQTSTFVWSEPGRHQDYAYARSANPTRSALEKNLASLENGRFARCFASGMAAIDAIGRLLRPGDEVVCSQDLYGGTYRIFTRLYEAYGIRFTFIDMQDPHTLKKTLSPSTRMVWFETPTNPLMRIVDITAVADLARQHGILSVIDNTFASPYLQNPLDMGIDLVVHSATKYIAGHSDVVMGAVVTNNEQLDEQIGFIQNTCGAVPGPNDCFLALRGIKTLHIRMDRHCQNTERIAHFLRSHPLVSRVYWPGFDDHPNHHIAKKQMKKMGGMLSFALEDDRLEEANRLMGRLRLFSLAESLGGVESLVGHPASMSHAGIPREKRLATGLSDSLIRLSVGIEDVSDLIDDLEQALG